MTQLLLSSTGVVAVVRPRCAAVVTVLMAMVFVSFQFKMAAIKQEPISLRLWHVMAVPLPMYGSGSVFRPVFQGC